MNTLIKSIEHEEVSCLGYVLDKILSPPHWFQFAGDTAIITALEGDNQLLCNIFTKWTSWADLIIRVDQCPTFGMKKSATGSIQYLPHVIVQRERIPSVELNESFIFLGKQFNFGLNIENIKTDIINDMVKYVRIIVKLPLTYLNKISIVQVYVFNKLRWKFSMHDLTETRVDENIDKIILKFLRKWCQLPACANVEHLPFLLSKLSINFKSAKMLYNQCKLSTRRILRQSKNPEIQKLCTLTSSRDINHDCLINSVSAENQNQVKIKIKFFLVSSLILESTVNLIEVYLIIPGTDL